MSALEAALPRDATRACVGSAVVCLMRKSWWWSKDAMAPHARPATCIPTPLSRHALEGASKDNKKSKQCDEACGVGHLDNELPGGVGCGRG